MAKLTIENVPDKVMQGLIDAYPDKNKRNRMILSSIIQLTKAENRRKIDHVLDNLELYSAKEKSIVEILREIRNER